MQFHACGDVAAGGDGGRDNSIYTFNTVLNMDLTELACRKYFLESVMWSEPRHKDLEEARPRRYLKLPRQYSK